MAVSPGEAPMFAPKWTHAKASSASVRCRPRAPQVVERRRNRQQGGHLEELAAGQRHRRIIDQ
jgi:hypothetical protein